MKTQLSFLVASTLLFGLASIGSAQAQQSSKPGISIAITAPLDAVKAGEKFPLKLVMTNISGHDIYLYTVYIGSIGSQSRLIDVQVEDSNGKPAAETLYGGTIHRRRFPTGGGAGYGSWFNYKPGEAVTEESDLNKEFDISKPGTYTVHAFSVDSDTKQTVTSNTITFTVTPR